MSHVMKCPPLAGLVLCCKERPAGRLRLLQGELPVFEGITSEAELSEAPTLLSATITLLYISLYVHFFHCDLCRRSPV